MHRHGRRILQNFLRYDGPPCMAQLIVKKKLGDLTMCHCEGKGVGDGVALGDTGIGPFTRTLTGPLVAPIWGLLEQAQAPAANPTPTENTTSCKMRPHAPPPLNRLPGAGFRESGAQNSTGEFFMNIIMAQTITGSQFAELENLSTRGRGRRGWRRMNQTSDGSPAQVRFKPRRVG